MVPSYYRYRIVTGVPSWSSRANEEEVVLLEAARRSRSYQNVAPGRPFLRIRLRNRFPEVPFQLSSVLAAVRPLN